MHMYLKMAPKPVQNKSNLIVTVGHSDKYVNCESKFEHKAAKNYFMARLISLTNFSFL